MKRLFAVLLVFIMLFAFAGCSDNYKSPDKAESLAIVVANRRNTYPAINSDKVFDYINRVVSSYGNISIIEEDGHPYVVDSLQIKKPTKSGLSKKQIARINEENTNAVLDILSECEPKTAEADTLKALKLAANELHSTDNDNKTLIVLSNGLSTTGSLNFTKDNLLYADAKEIASQLNDMAEIPDLNGINVIWFGLGFTTQPQTELNSDSIVNLKAIWTEIINAGNAESVSFATDNVLFENDQSSYPEVSCVTVMANELIIDNLENKITVLDEELLAFKSDSTEFVDDDKAIDALKPIAEYMSENKNYNILLAGTTATVGSQDKCKGFSLKRADKVKKILVSMGIDEERIHAIGMGYNHPYHINDIDANGLLIENIAKKNRSVIIINSELDDARYLIENYE